ncbi:PRC-barrel domain containing protein [Halomonas sp. ZH2S]|uniref:PRC-barrel domain containing protein n=1 Tax=Vreelandella zhuhanensis TaxID=2684210 RepID=A0A7X3GYA3_9GAMM|nr:PRC-barrel domain-containing protein [Halomonas zhuhanensis]MWJ27108.1 PRC-barrel domain containing protein [Halomonas zhuhanensis]
MRKATLTLAVAAIASGYALGTHASDDAQPHGSQNPQGLYSAEDILDADVFFAHNVDEEIGEVEDILFDDAMSISALVIESGDILGLGGREIVIEPEYFKLETSTEGDGDTEHRILIDASSEEVENFPTYDRDWWEQAKQNTREAWQNTRQDVESAWQRTREAIENN